ncbi:MAG: OFA family MFS transporter [Desulfobulbus sp.]|jgi:OFA family oxalate/formate antiporter-like MFS transporter
MKTNTAGANRWLIAIMGTLLQVCLGTVYAWSFFQKPLVTAFNWSNTQAAWAFSLAIFFLGFAAAWGGMYLPKYGPRKLAMIGAALYGSGWLLGGIALSQHNLVLLYLGYGVIGGIGLGLGYVTPVATVAKWFPDKKGFVTGMVVMGFGFGALVLSKIIAPILVAAFGMTGPGLIKMFYAVGVILLVCGVVAGLFLRNPPEGFVPEGYTPPAAPEPSTTQKAAGQGAGLSVGDCLMSPRFALMWLIFFCNITAGIMFIGFQSPMLQDLLKIRSPEMTTEALAAAGATLIAISSLFNGVGRFFWGGLSDRIGRIQAFRLILGSQIFVFIALLFTKQPIIFGILVCYVLLCYGGGFGSMPSFVLDVFGAKLMPVVYGTILTAWSFAGIAGPQLVAIIKDMFAASPEKVPTYTFCIGAGLLVVGFVLSLMLNNKKFEKGGITAQ